MQKSRIAPISGGGGGKLKAPCSLGFGGFSIDFMNALRHEGTKVISRSALPCRQLVKMLNQVQHDTTRKAAFTLAEVLITLGIIGVVAAITIPALMTKIQKSILQQQFNSAYSKLTQAIKMIEAQEGSVPYCNGWNTQCSQFYTQLAKQLKVVQYCPNKAYEKGCIPQWHGLDDFEGKTEEQKQSHRYHMPNYCTNNILNSNSAYVFIDGVILMPYSASFNFFLLDINGKKGPNKWGYDIFSFEVIPFGENSAKILGSTTSENGGKSSVLMISNMKKRK